MTEEQAKYDLENPPVRKGALDLAVSERGALMVRSYMELMQMAALYHKSGMAPNSLDTLEKVAIGMATCLEIGVPIVTGLQHVAVINGRASIWGDLVMSIVRGSGLLEEFQEEETGKPFQDDWTFTCKLKRRGMVQATGYFTWAEAKLAGLDNPQRRGGGNDMFSPWRRFPRRMMQWAARRWVIRDQFSDVLKGIVLAEDALESVEMTRGSDGSYSAPLSLPSQEKPVGKPIYEVKKAPRSCEIGKPETFKCQNAEIQTGGTQERVDQAVAERAEKVREAFEPHPGDGVKWQNTEVKTDTAATNTETEVVTSSTVRVGPEHVDLDKSSLTDKQKAAAEKYFTGHRLATDGPPEGVTIGGKKEEPEQPPEGYADFDRMLSDNIPEIKQKRFDLYVSARATRHGSTIEETRQMLCRIFPEWLEGWQEFDASLENDGQANRTSTVEDDFNRTVLARIPDGNRQGLAAYIHDQAVLGQSDIAAVMRWATENPDRFIEGFYNFIKRMRNKEPERKESTAGAGFSDQHPWARRNWINIRTAGYSTYVHKNIDTFKDAPPEIRTEAQGKWKALYKDQPWPTPESKEAANSEPEEPAEPIEGGAVHNDAPLLLGRFPADYRDGMLGQIMATVVRADMVYTQTAKAVEELTGISKSVLQAERDPEERYSGAYEFLKHVAEKMRAAGKDPHALLPASDLNGKTTVSNFKKGDDDIQF